MSRERYWGVPDAESEGQAVVPSFQSLKGSGAAGGLNWGRGTWREAHSGEGVGRRVGIREESGEFSARLAIGYRSQRENGGNRVG